MDGTEQTLFENTELGEFSGYIFLKAMGASDVITIRAKVMNKETEEYELADTGTFTGVQTTSCIRIAQVIGKMGLQVTAQQTAGTYRTITSMWFKR